MDAVMPVDAVVCTDGHSAFHRLNKSLEVGARYFVAGKYGHTNKTFHVPTPNNYPE